MKSISNILLAAILIIYIFLPLFDLGLFGKITGFEFTEQTLNSSGSAGKKDILINSLHRLFRSNNI